MKQYQRVVAPTVNYYDECTSSYLSFSPILKVQNCWPYHCTLSSFQPQMWMAGLSDTLDGRAASEAASRQEGEAGRWVLGL